MLPLTHMGIGSRIVKPWARELPIWALLLGTLLPDLIDKPLFYAMLNLNNEALGYINNTRTLGHTAIFLIGVTLFAGLTRSRVLAAVALGMGSHLFLDNLGDSLFDVLKADPDHPATHSAMIALLWPFYKPYFAESPFTSLAGHVHRAVNPLSLGGEVVGFCILGWDYWQRRYEPEILKDLMERRRARKDRKRKHRHGSHGGTLES